MVAARLTSPTGRSPSSTRATISTSTTAPRRATCSRRRAGTYSLLRNVRLTPQDSGVRIEGAGVDTTVLDRGPRIDGAYPIEMAGADDVTLAHLTIAGGQFQVFAADGADSDRLTVRDSRLVGEHFFGAGILVGYSNDDAQILNDVVD